MFAISRQSRFQGTALLVLATITTLTGTTLTGCSNSEYPLAPVSGVVTLDREPLAGARVFFMPVASGEKQLVGPRSVGKTDESGYYELITPAGDKGAVIGAHRVRISTYETAPDPKSIDNVIIVAEERVPLAYLVGDSLDREVPAMGLENCNFELKSKRNQ